MYGNHKSERLEGETRGHPRVQPAELRRVHDQLVMLLAWHPPNTTCLTFSTGQQTEIVDDGIKIHVLPRHHPLVHGIKRDPPGPLDVLPRRRLLLRHPPRYHPLLRLRRAGFKRVDPPHVLSDPRPLRQGFKRAVPPLPLQRSVPHHGMP